MNDFLQWFEAHKPTAHTVTAVWVMLDTLWYTNTDFHAYVMAGFNDSPKWVHALIAGIIIPIFVYWRTARTAKVTVTAEPGAEATATVNAAVTPVDPNASK